MLAFITARCVECGLQATLMVSEKAFRKGIAAIIFRNTRAGPRFLLLHRTQNWRGWEFVKGGRRPSETEHECLHRELSEETGLVHGLIIRLPYKIEYAWPKQYAKDGRKYGGVSLRLYAVRAKTTKPRIDPAEHDAHKWTPLAQALRLLTYDNQRRALKYAAGRILQAKA